MNIAFQNSAPEAISLHLMRTGVRLQIVSFSTKKINITNELLDYLVISFLSSNMYFA